MLSPMTQEWKALIRFFLETAAWLVGAVFILILMFFGSIYLLCQSGACP